jgi:hypothetical protein
MFYGKPAPFSTHLRTFGEMGIVRNIQTVKTKLEDRGSTSMFLGYAKQHAGTVYRMLNLQNGTLCLSRDVMWLNQSYGEYKKHQKREDVTTIPRQPEEDDDEEDHATSEEKEEDLEESVQSEKDEIQEVKIGRSILSFQPKPEGRTRSGRVYKDIVAIAQERSNPKTNEEAYDDPETFVEAWNHSNSNERNGWREAIKKEFNVMN